MKTLEEMVYLLQWSMLADGHLLFGSNVQELDGIGFLARRNQRFPRRIGRIEYYHRKNKEPDTYVLGDTRNVLVVVEPAVDGSADVMIWDNRRTFVLLSNGDETKTNRYSVAHKSKGILESARTAVVLDPESSARLRKAIVDGTLVSIELGFRSTERLKINTLHFVLFALLSSVTSAYCSLAIAKMLYRTELANVAIRIGAEPDHDISMYEDFVTSSLYSLVTVSTCSICLESIEKDERIKLLPCMHYFHSSCVDIWIIHHRQMSCPVCRFDLQGITSINVV
jgi:hypothetical protein